MTTQETLTPDEQQALDSLRPEEDVNLEDVFDSMSETLGLERDESANEEAVVASEPKPEDEFSLDEAVEAAPEVKEEEGEAKEETPAEDSEIDKLTQKVEMLTKQQKDTRDWATTVNQKAQAVIQKMSTGETVTQEEVDEILTAVKQQETEIDEVVATLNEQLPMAAEVAREFTGETAEQIEEAITAFNNLASADVMLQKELMELPAASRASFVIKRGRELKEVYKDVVKQGSFVQALAKSSTVTQEALTAAEKVGYDKAMLEVGKAIPSVKPELRNTGGITTQEEIAGEPSLDDIF